MRIIKLEAENVKRLRAVSVTPKGSTVVIGGKNAQGKTSLLDSIEMVLGGKGAVPAEPLRRGEKRGHATIELDDIIVKRTFTEGGGTQLIVTAKDGSKVARPQEVLDGLVSRLSFDPLRFTRMDPKEQVATLRELAGVDFTALDADRALVFEKRTENTRELRRVSALFEKATWHDDAPEKEVSVADLLAELETRRRQNAAVQADRAKLAKMRADAQQMFDDIQRLEAELAALKEKREQLLKDGKVFAGQVAALVEANETEVSERIRSADETNRKVRENAEYDAMDTQLERLSKADAEMTARLSMIDEAKREQLAAARFHVPGLSFDDDGVKLNGLPLAQASSAEQLRVSLAIGLAMNPTLKLMLIRDGSLLDEDSLAMVEQTAAAADAQVWIEVVGTNGPATVVIEDGQVRSVSER
jgi:DNA repair exonuclease SbcCD ATPase subunit